MPARASLSPSGTAWCPWIIPILIGPCCNVVDAGMLAFYSNGCSLVLVMLLAVLSERTLHLVPISSGSADVWRYRSEIVVGLLVRHVAGH